MQKIIVCALMIAMFTLTSCQVENNSSVTNLHEREKIVFDAPVLISNLQQTLREAGVQIDELTFAQGEIQGGFRFRQGEDFDAGIARFQALHQEFLRDVLVGIQAEIANAAPSDIGRLVKFEELFRASQETFHVGGLCILSVTTSPEGMLLIQSRHGGQPALHPQPTVVDSNAVGVSYSTSHESWAPYAGTSKVTQGLSYQTFYFNNVGSYALDSTYEHETQVYNQNFANYGGYWSSNLPNAYYDTPFADNIDNFTIGSSTAYRLQVNTMYFTTMALTAGSSPSATVRIKGQKGFRFPFACYSTWCIFAQATTGSMATFTAPAQNISWQY